MARRANTTRPKARLRKQRRACWFDVEESSFEDKVDGHCPQDDLKPCD